MTSLLDTLELTESTLLEDAVNVGMEVSALTERVRNADLTLEERVALYGEVNPLKKDLEDTRQSLRDEIVDEVKSLCDAPPASGKLVLSKEHPLLSQTSKGAIVLKAEAEGVMLELRPKVQEVFEEDLARKFLQEKELLQACEESTTTVKDASALTDAVGKVLTFLDDLKEEPLAAEVADSLRSAWAGNTVTTTRISQERIKAMVVLEKLDMDSVTKMFSTKYSYSLYEKEK